MKRFFPNEPRPEPGGDDQPRPPTPANQDATIPVPPGPTVEAAGATAAGATMADAQAPATPADTPLRGASQYQLGGVVARGGMGSILEARELNLDRLVAVKVILSENTGSESHRQRFLQEARLTGQLQHPNIVPVYELGNTAEGHPFYTMKFVKGTTLAEVLEGIKQGDPKLVGQYSLAHLLTIFQKVCDAVAFAHSRGVIHRDLKPANIMIGEFGEVLVMDWGLAKVVGSDAGTVMRDREPPNHSSRITDHGLTLAGQVMGSPNFMAPEQAEGRIEEIDARTDIFALGGVLYSILTLHPPVTGDSLEEILQRIRSGAILHPSTFNPKSRLRKGPVPVGAAVIPYPPLIRLRHCPGGRIPDSLAAVAMKALALRREDRYQTVPELQRDIDAHQTGFATAAEEAGLLKQLWLLIKRHKVEFLVSHAALLILFVAAAVFVIKIHAEKTRAVASERHAVEALARLRATAPTSYDQARSLVQEQKFDEALVTIDAALLLAPENADYHTLKGDILESLLRIEPARAAYTEALRLDSQQALASENLNLCERILQANAGRQELLPNSLADLQALMVQQGRAAEALRMLRRLNTDKQRLYDTWKAVLVKAGWWGIAEKKGIAGFFGQYEDGTFALSLPADIVDLTPIQGMPLKVLNMIGNDVADLRPLAGMPLTFLNSVACKRIKDLAPLKGMPLQFLDVSQSQVNDLSPLQGMPLEDLRLGLTPVSDLRPLQGLPLKMLGLGGCASLRDITPLRGMTLDKLDLGSTPVTDLAPLQGMRLQYLELHAMPITDLTPLRGMPVRTLIITGCEQLRDLTPLADCAELEELAIPIQCTDLEVLRRLPHLKMLTYDWRVKTPAAEFWKDYDAKKAGAPKSEVKGQ